MNKTETIFGTSYVVSENGFDMNESDISDYRTSYVGNDLIGFDGNGYIRFRIVPLQNDSEIPN